MIGCMMSGGGFTLHNERKEDLLPSNTLAVENPLNKFLHPRCQQPNLVCVCVCSCIRVKLVAAPDSLMCARR